MGYDISLHGRAAPQHACAPKVDPITRKTVGKSTENQPKVTPFLSTTYRPTYETGATSC